MTAHKKSLLFPSPGNSHCLFPIYLGHYCVDGAQTGPCTAGFWCKKGNPSPWPYANETDPSIGQPCPYGYYCPAGKFTILLSSN